MREYGRLNLVWAELAGNAPAPPLPLLHPPGCSYPSLSGEAKVAPAPQGYCPWGKGAVLQFIHIFFMINIMVETDMRPQKRRQMGNWNVPDFYLLLKRMIVLLSAVMPCLDNVSLA